MENCESPPWPKVLYMVDSDNEKTLFELQQKPFVSI